jgi:signal transduction histidine kinase
LDTVGHDQLNRIVNGVERMQALINDLLTLSKIVRAPLTREQVDLSVEAHAILASLRDGESTGRAAPSKKIETVIADRLIVDGDPGLLRVVLQNLLSNAWKFTSKRELARIEVGSRLDDSGERTYFVRDNGAGFDSANAPNLFGPFQRLHTQAQFPGTGIGLATVQRIVHRHGGRIWAESAVDRGTSFYFTLGARA